MKCVRLALKLAVLTLAACTNPLAGTSSSKVDSNHRPGSFAPPLALQGAVAASPGLITVTWTTAAGASSYRVDYGTSQGVYTNSVVVSSSTTSVTLAGLTNGQTYFVMVTAIIASGSISLAEELQVQPIGTFGIVSTAQLSPTSISVSWASAAGASTYDVLFGTAANQLDQTLIGASSPQVITGLTSGLRTFVQVRAKNTVGSGSSQLSASVVEVTSSAPTISPIGPQMTSEDLATGPISFTIQDLDSTLACDSSSLAMSSDNTALVDSADVVWGGTSPNCTAIVTANSNQSGNAQLTFTVRDPSSQSNQTSFNLSVAAVNDPPTLAGLSSVSVNEDTSSNPLALALNDIDSTVSCSGSLSATSSVDSVVAPSGLVFSGTVPNCSLVITPASNAYGTSLISVTATDGTLSVTGSFTVTVNQLGDDGLVGNLIGFDNSLHYTAATGVDVNSGSNGLAQLSKADLIDDAISATGGDLDFSGYSSKSANINLIDGKLILDVASSNDAAATGAVSSGELVSRVIDGKNAAIDWNGIRFKTRLPFGKELSLSTETGYVDTVTDFSSQLMAHYRFNESASGSGAGGTDLVDAKFGNNGVRTGSPLFNQSGILGAAAQFSGSNQYFTVPDSINLDGSSVLTLSAWFYPMTVDANPRAILSKRVGSVATNHAYSLFLHTGGKLFVDTVGTTNRFSGATVLVPNRWYHAVVVYDGSLSAGSRTRLYLNGKLDGTGAGPASIGNTASNLFLGTLNDAYGNYFHGRIDEVAVWKRAMTPIQVSELYRRGSNRVGVQLRACDDASCAIGSPSWIGADGTSGTLFSEIRNTATGAFSSAVLATPISATFSTLRSTFSNLNSWATSIPFGSIQNIKKQYYQFRVVLESLEATTSTNCDSVNVNSTAGTKPCAAEVSAVEFFNNRFDSTAPSVITKSSGPDIGVEFFSLSGFSVAYGAGSCVGDRYQLAVNNTGTWYYYNGTAWSVGTDYSTASTASVINSNIGSFPTSVARGKLYVRAFLGSTGSTACELDSITINGAK